MLKTFHLEQFSRSSVSLEVPGYYKDKRMAGIVYHIGEKTVITILPGYHIGTGDTKYFKPDPFLIPIAKDEFIKAYADTSSLIESRVNKIIHGDTTL